VTVLSALPARHSYSIYGVRVDSDVPFSFPIHTADPMYADYLAGVEFAESGDGAFARFRRAAESDEEFVFESSLDGTAYLRWRPFYEFTVAADGSQVLYRPLNGPDTPVFQNFLLGQVLAVALVRRGLEPLHAAAVRVGDAAIAFLGDCTFGKSTLLASFAHAGFRVLTDDMLILQPRSGALYARPGSGRIKLLPDSARRFLADIPDSEPMTPMTTKRSFLLDELRRQTASLPLRLLYVLPNPDERDQTGSASIRPASQAEMACELLKSSFTIHLVDRARLERQFDHAATVAAGVRGFWLNYPGGLDRVADVRDAVVRHSASELALALHDGERNE
jgi:hypothetical protein